MAPRAPPPVPGEAQMPLAADSPFAGLPIVAVSASALRRGRTAFAVGEAGVWVSASAGPRACGKPGLVVADGRAVPPRVARRTGGDTGPDHRRRRARRACRWPRPATCARANWASTWAIRKAGRARSPRG